MKKLPTFCVLILWILTSATYLQADDDWPVFEGLYLGQKPPGMTPEKFAAGIVTTADTMEYCMAFTPDMRAIYFNRYGGGGKGIWVVHCTDGHWSKPVQAPFYGKFPGGEVHVTPDGSGLMMNLYRGVADAEKRGIWMLRKTDSGWGDPLFLIRNGMRATSSLSGEIFVTDITNQINKTGGDVGIITSYIRRGHSVDKRDSPEFGINSESIDSHPFIASDGSYMIFNSDRPGGKGKGDLYITWRLPDAAWSPPVNMEDLNTSEGDWCATVSPDGKYLFFTRNITGGGDIYWVDAAILQKYKPAEFPILKGPYLGQKPPGMTPEIFAPRVLSKTKPEWAFCAVFHPDGKGFYFVNDRPAKGMEHIVCMTMVNGTWIPPKEVAVNRGYLSNNFGFSPDGNKIFFRSWRPLPGHDQQKKVSSLWYAQRVANNWQEARPVRCGGDFLKRVGQPSVGASGNLYFATIREDSIGSSDIYRARMMDGIYGPPENIGAPINTEYGEADLCVSPDEEFLVVTCWDNPDNHGGSDLYIGFSQADGTWSAPINMGAAVNSEHNESAPTLSPDGKYLFFVRVDVRAEIAICSTLWVDAKIIQDLKPKNI